MPRGILFRKGGASGASLPTNSCVCSGPRDDREDEPQADFRQMAVKRVKFTIEPGCRDIFRAADFQKNGIAHRSPFAMESPLGVELTATRARYRDAAYVFETVRSGPACFGTLIVLIVWFREARLKAKLSKKVGAGWHMFRRELASDLADTPLALVKALLASKNPHVLLAAYREPRVQQLRKALQTRKQLMI